MLEKTTLQDASKGIKVYRTRWYVILMVSMANALNNFMWATWGPIADSAKLVYDWTDATIFWVTNAGNIAAFLATAGGVYLIDAKGLRWAMLFCTFLQALAATTRIITQTLPASTILITIGQVLNGMGTTVVMALPPAVSETWFHVSERTTATAISCMSAAVGAGASFLFGPYMVTMPVRNGTVILRNETDIPEIRKDMEYLHLVIFSISIALFFATVLYLPAKPMTAPSRTATMVRYKSKEALVKLLKTPTVWLIGCLFAVPAGVYGTWSTLLYPIIKDLGFTQEEVGWIGFYGSVAGILAALVVGRLSDLFTHKKKLMIIALYTGSVISFLWFTFMCYDILPRSKAFIYVSAILGSMCLMSTNPLFLEIICEVSYPISEAISAGFLGFFINFGAAVYLFVTMAPRLEMFAMNWVLCGILGLAAAFTVFMKVEYKRINIDTQLPL